jgi:hypothetical protein
MAKSRKKKDDGGIDSAGSDSGPENEDFELPFEDVVN